MSLYSRLEQYLEEHSDDAGPVRGTLSLPRIGMIWLAANLVVTTLLTGTLFVPGVDYGLVSCSSSSAPWSARPCS